MTIEAVPLDRPRHEEYSVHRGTATALAMAGLIDNVNCLACRRNYFERKR